MWENHTPCVKSRAHPGLGPALCGYACMATWATQDTCMATWATQDTCMATWATQDTCMATRATQDGCMATWATQVACMATWSKIRAWQREPHTIRASQRKPHKIRAWLREPHWEWTAVSTPYHDSLEWGIKIINESGGNLISFAIKLACQLIYFLVNNYFLIICCFMSRYNFTVKSAWIYYKSTTIIIKLYLIISII